MFRDIAKALDIFTVTRKSHIRRIVADGPNAPMHSRTISLYQTLHCSQLYIEAKKTEKFRRSFFTDLW